jgi:hypothetical protein
MPVAACGVSCDVCGLYVKGICGTCAAGTEERALQKLDEQMELINMHCPILACAVERKVGYCLKDCEEFPCTKFESGFESLMGPGSYPYSRGFLAMFKARIGKK